jgi:TPR repeat protein
MGATPPKEALLIANGKYSHFAGLAHPRLDAAKLSAALEQLGFRVRVVQDGNREQMLLAISDFERGLHNTGAIAFFHYGGHGVQVDGKNYLLPADADIPDERRVVTRAVSLDEVMTAMDAAAARASIIVIDACRDNPLPAGSSRNLSRGLSVVEMKPKNSIVIYAAEAGSKALDGLFTPILAMALQEKGRTIDQVMKSVRREVYARSSGQQTPGEYNQLFEDLFLSEPPASDLSSEQVTSISTQSIPIKTTANLTTNFLNFESAIVKADAGDAYAQAVVSIYYGLGLGCNKDSIKSKEYAMKSAKQLNPLGIYRLAEMRESGEAMEKNADQAKQLMQKAKIGLQKLSGDPYAMTALAVIYQRENPASPKARELLIQASDMGYAPAQTKLTQLETNY